MFSCIFKFFERNLVLLYFIGFNEYIGCLLVLDWTSLPIQNLIIQPIKTTLAIPAFPKYFEVCLI